MLPILASRHWSNSTAIACVAVVMCVAGVRAEQIAVNTTLDTIPADATLSAVDSDGHISLRSAAMRANETPEADTIIIPTGNYVRTRYTFYPWSSQDSGQVRFNGSTTIIGAGLDRTIVDAADDFDIVFGVGGQNTVVRFEGLTIKSGYAYKWSGGGISSYGAIEVSRCRFMGNSGTRGGAIAVGGPLLIGNQQASAHIDNSIFDGNTVAAALTAAMSYGGAIAIAGQGNLVVENCTFVGNYNASTSPFHQGHAIYSETTGSVTIVNSIVWGVDSPQVSIVGSNPAVIRHCAIQGVSGPFTGDGNIAADPLLDSGFRLLPGSPCIDAGNNALVPAAQVTDAFGRSRIADDPTALDCPQVPGACGIAPIVDIGAYEVFTDCDANGIDDALDVLQTDCNTNGIPDACDSDGDGDGLPDACDGCPADPAKTDPGACGCGMLETDSDGDQAPDCVDTCPNDPDKSDPGVCGCGAPDADAENDGIPDCIDNCPAHANPDQADVDGDGVGDACSPTEPPPAFRRPHCGCGVIAGVYATLIALAAAQLGGRPGRPDRRR